MLAQKNSEATRALALQGERLEKELGEVQKVLLAMQVNCCLTTIPRFTCLFQFPRGIVFYRKVFWGGFTSSR